MYNGCAPLYWCVQIYSKITICVRVYPVRRWSICYNKYTHTICDIELVMIVYFKKGYMPKCNHVLTESSVSVIQSK